MKSYIDDIVVTDPNGEEAVLYPRTKQEAVEGLQERLSNIELPDITTTDQTTLPNSHAGRLKFNEIVGDIEQDSTEGNQLFDSSTAVSGYIYTTGNLVESTSSVSSDYIESSGNITVSANVTAMDTVTIAFYDSGKNFIERIYQSSLPFSSAAVENCAYVRVTFNIDGDEMSVARLLTYEPMVNEGNTALPYEPFTNGASPNPEYPQDIKTTVVSEIRTHNKNFLDCRGLTEQTINGVKYTPVYSGDKLLYIEANGTAGENGSTLEIVGRGNGNAETILFPNRKTILSVGNIGCTNSTYRGCVWGNIDGTSKSTTFKNSINRDADFNYTGVGFKIEAGYTATNLRIYPMVYDADIEDATYEPYQGKEIALSQPITLYRDVLTAKEIERKYGVAVFDGSEDWVISTTKVEGIHRLATLKLHDSVKNVASNSDIPNVLCNQCSAVTPNDTYMAMNGITVNTTGVLYVYSEQFNTNDVELWKAHLAETPMTVVYELAESTTETLPTVDQIALNSLPTFDGVTYVEFIDVGVQPSVSIDYGTSKIGGMTLEGLLAGINGELQSQLNNDRITALESAVVNNV